MKYLSILLFLTFIFPFNVKGEDKIVLSGKIKLEKALFFEGKTLIIEKNTLIEIDTEEEHVIHIKNGELYINGAYQNPVIIKSKRPHNEQNAFFIEDSQANIKNAVFENNGWSIHVHNSEVSIENSIFKNNFGGIRFFNSKTYIKRNLFEKNEIAIRFINSNNNEIIKNIFYQNQTAIFIREGIHKVGIKENVFIKNLYDFYTGFFQTESLNIPFNYYYETPSIFDKTKDEDISIIINIHPVLNDFPDWH
ncbi:MAG: right-handed parallel beta-helix repeat-containing protein [Proteobacteria bacterium]|nr:right-handed parallel beta-helix repeat-containing protein [Pseudomonadota bacterium]